MKVRENLITLQKKGAKKRILVLGDLMADHYIWGKSDRMSPEAPVPVVEVESEDLRAGGAANVGNNLMAMKAKAILCGMLGNDGTGKKLMSLLKKSGFDTDWILKEKGRITTLKTRIIANEKHLLRLDQEDKHSILEKTKSQLLSVIQKKVKTFDAIIFEDYDKGALDEDFIQTLITIAIKYDVPVIVDPKFRNFLSYSGCTLFKPNLKELNEALGLHLTNKDLEGLKLALLDLRNKMPHKQTLLTLGEQGMLGLDEHRQFFHVPGIPIEVKDVSGAGDTVAAVMGLALACKLNFQDAAHLANLAGAQVCQQVGVVPIELGDLI